MSSSIPYPIPDNEADRLAALRSYEILDTFPEEEYDAITRLASYICQVPLAFITFIDDDRQWFKSKVGIPVEEVPRAHSMCKYTILDDILVEVADTTLNKLYADNELVTGQAGIRFYASAPLVDPDGYRLGSLCVFDQKPKNLSPEQRDALQTLAREVMSHLAVRKQKRDLEKSLKQREDFFNLFNNSSEIHFVAGADANIEIINNAVCDILGYHPQKIIGHSLWSFVVGHNREQYVPLIEKAVATQQPFELETATTTSSGEVKWLSWTGIYKNDKWYASGRDITEQKQLAAEREQLSLVASKVSNGVAITDANNRIVWINDAFADITGYYFTDVAGRQMAEVLGGDYEDAAILEKTQSLIKSNKAFEIDLRIRRKDNELAWISVINSAVLDHEGNISKYIKVIIDITARKHAEQELETLSFAARKSPSGILIRDNDSNVLWMNEALEEMTGYTLKEMKGKAFGKLITGPDTDYRVFDAARKAIAEGRPYDVEIKLYHRNGKPIWAHVNNSPLVNEAGQIDRQVGVLVDVTERKQTEEQLNLLSLVARNTVSGVVINDAEGNVEWVNSAFETITGYDLTAVRGRHLGDVLKGELTDAALIEQSRELSRNKQSFEVDLLIYRKDGQPLWMTIINSVILDNEGRVSKYIEVVIDISARKKAELDLIAAREEALQLSRAKDMFISVMSHEIRTPLNAVIGMSHLLLADNPAESQKENLNILKFSAENLMMLINDVLDFAKIDSGHVELEQVKVDIRELVQSVTNSMQFKGNDKHIYIKSVIDPAVPPVVLGDRTRLTQILLNIVSNSVKFTEKGGVTIEVQALEQTEGEVKLHFAVKDTGIGIAPDKINTIFESFKQASADTTRKYGGTGLGLAITKRLVELHDSHIQVESELGKGSVFYFNILFKKDENINHQSINRVDSVLNLHALVVDDNQINRLLINKVLKKWNATADFAENGQEAIDKLDENRNYDVVLMDIHMPVMGGLEAAKELRLRNDVYLQQVPIIALTASMLHNQMDEIHQAGMNDYVLKPFDPKVLYDKLSRYQKA
ncbi:hypothetical protein GCM10027037_32830 [Mucilaginibacter koreensis]